MAYAYVSKREGSLQKAAYHIMPELWIRKILPRVVDANMNVPDKRVKKSFQENNY